MNINIHEIRVIRVIRVITRAFNGDGIKGYQGY